jgi:molybdenum cofactor synthesis domain-containing protein
VRPFTSTISIDEARKRLAAGVQPVVGSERVPLSDAGGRVAAEDVSSSIAVPPFERSAMDGYAVVAADTATASKESPARLRVVDRIFTGGVTSHAVRPGACAEIATGAPMPEGADAVVMVEETDRPSGSATVSIFARAAAGQHIGRKGADISPGDRVVRAGDWLNPSRLGALAAIGRDSVSVYRRPRVAVLSTGNEVIDPGMPLAAGQIYDVNRFTLGAVVSAHGGEALPHPPVGDTLDALTAALDACAAADVIIFSGGSSVGERDLIVDLVAARGEMIFHGIAVRPGKPTAFAAINGKPFFGMPGNPTSCLSNAYILLVPFLRATARLPVYAPRTVRARMGRRIESAVGRHQFYTVKLNGTVAVPAFKGSGEITSLSQADGYIEIPADQSVVEKDGEVEVILF